MEIWACAVVYYHDGDHKILLGSGVSKEASIGDAMRVLPIGAELCGRYARRVAHAPKTVEPAAQTGDPHD